MPLSTASRGILGMFMVFSFVAHGAAAGAPSRVHADQSAAKHASAAVVKVLSLVGDPRHPTTLYIGGSAASPDAYRSGFYGYWRSTDSGTTWSDLGHALGLGQTFTGHTDSSDPTSDPILGQTVISPFRIAPDDSYLLAATYHQPSTPGTAYSQVIRSSDGGLSWMPVSGEVGEYGNGQFDPVISPVAPQRAYRQNSSGDFSGSLTRPQVSSDGGVTWSDVGDAGTQVDSSLSSGAIVPDAARANTVYTGYGDADAVYSGIGLQWLRSDDAGMTWSTVITPTDVPPLSSYSLATDSHLPGMLVSLTTTKGIPADRRYLSSDEGRTWSIASCPGDLAGACPRLTVENVFGAGASYGFYADGIHPFHLVGPANARLAISGDLPVLAQHVAYVFAGAHAGDPIYLLTDDKAGGLSDRLYRSMDAGRSWQRIAANLLPNSAPPSNAPGTLLVPATRHSVAVPFVARYRQLGLQIIGYPVTEAYLQSDVLTQDFEHLRLQLRHGSVIVAPLGVDVYYYGTTWEEPDPAPSVLVPSPRTLAQAPTGQFAAFWRSHGGLAVFGAPITPVFDSYNLDGSKREYTMQYFQNARMELHLEIKNPAYRISLGLLGQESLYARGWTVPSS